jgi:HK97 family phage major capsid protein
VFIQLKKEFLGKPAGERLDMAPDHADMLIKQGVAEAVLGDPLAPLVNKTIEQAMNRLSEGISSSVDLALKQFADAQGQAHKHAVPLIFGTGPARDDAYLEKEYGSTRAEPRTKASLAEASGVTGGYVVPPEFLNQLMALIVEQAVIRPLAYVQPMASATLMVPFLDVTTVQASGTSPFFGAVNMKWTEEAQTRTETEPQFKQMELKAHELSGYAVSSNVLLQDAAFGLEKFLMTLFSKAIAWFEDYAFFQGNGVGKPLGILNAKATIAVTRAGGQGTSTFTYADAAKMLSRLLPSSQKSAIWCIHPYVLEKLVQLADSSGRLVWVPNIAGAQDKVPGSLFGLPVKTTEKLPTLGGKGDVSLLDPQLYVIGDRMQIEIAASQHVNFLNNQMTWRVVERVDGQPWLDNAITLQDGSSTVSPFVVLN